MEHRLDRLEQLLRLILMLLQERSAQKEHHTVAEAAEILRRSQFRVRELLKAGLLKGYKSKRRAGRFEKWVIPAEAIREFQAGRDGFQQPPGAAGCVARLKKPPKAPSGTVHLATESLAGSGGR